MTTAAVADAGPLIHLAEIDSLDLVSVLDQLYVPETVYGEIEAGGVPRGMQSLSYERVTSERPRFERPELDDGERAALRIADEYDVFLLTDDLAAREIAGEIGVDVHGSLGLIALAYSERRIEREDAANRMRALQRETSLFITQTVVERGIAMLDESN